MRNAEQLAKAAQDPRMRGQDIVGLRPLETSAKGKPWKYRHVFEHRGYGIVCIYSFGPCREHEDIVAEARRVMRSRFGVSGAVSSGGCSNNFTNDEWRDEPDWQDRTTETQTIFTIHAAGGPRRPKLKEVSARQADWHVAYVVDVSQAYLGDGEVNRYFAGPLEDEDTWQELVDRSVCEVLDAGESGATVLGLTVRATPQGAYWFLNDGDPVVSVARFEVTP